MSPQIRSEHSRALTLIAVLLAFAGCQNPPPPPNAAPNRTNELPFGFVEAPPAGATVERKMVVGGWALDDEGVKEVRIFVDNKFAGRTSVDQPRADVTKAYPTYPAAGDLHGWVTTVTLGEAIQEGSHTVLVQAVDIQGATKDIGTVAVVVPPVK